MQQQVRILAHAFTPRQLRFTLAALVAAVAFALAAPAHANAAKAAEREFADAVQQFKEGRRAHAFGMFIALANRGDVDAARIALFMHQFGPTLYGTHWEASRDDIEYWNTLLRNSSTAGRAQPDFVPLAAVPKTKVKQVRTTRVAAAANSGAE